MTARVSEATIANLAKRLDLRAAELSGPVEIGREGGAGDSAEDWRKENR